MDNHPELTKSTEAIVPDAQEARSTPSFRSGQIVLAVYILLYMFLRFTTVIDHQKMRSRGRTKPVLTYVDTTDLGKIIAYTGETGSHYMRFNAGAGLDPWFLRVFYPLCVLETGVWYCVDPFQGTPAGVPRFWRVTDRRNGLINDPDDYRTRTARTGNEEANVPDP